MEEKGTFILHKSAGKKILRTRKWDTKLWWFSPHISLIIFLLFLHLTIF